MMSKFSHLNHSRPLIVVGMSTTGPDPSKDHILELGALKFHPGGPVEPFHERLRKRFSIPTPERVATNSEQLKGDEYPWFWQIADWLYQYFNDADLAGYALYRDVRFLAAEFARCQMPFDLTGRAMIDARAIFMRHEPHDLGAAAQFYCGVSLSRRRNSLDDARAAAEVLDAQLARYDELPNTVPELHRYLGSLHGIL